MPVLQKSGKNSSQNPHDIILDAYKELHERNLATNDILLRQPLATLKKLKQEEERQELFLSERFKDLTSQDPNANNNQNDDDEDYYYSEKQNDNNGKEEEDDFFASSLDPRSRHHQRVGSNSSLQLTLSQSFSEENSQSQNQQSNNNKMALSEDQIKNRRLERKRKRRYQLQKKRLLRMVRSKFLNSLRENNGTIGDTDENHDDENTSSLINNKKSKRLMSSSSLHMLAASALPASTLSPGNTEFNDDDDDLFSSFDRSHIEFAFRDHLGVDSARACNSNEQFFASQMGVRYATLKSTVLELLSEGAKKKKEQMRQLQQREQQRQNKEQNNNNNAPSHSLEQNNVSNTSSQQLRNFGGSAMNSSVTSSPPTGKPSMHIANVPSFVNNVPNPKGSQILHRSPPNSPSHQQQQGRVSPTAGTPTLSFGSIPSMGNKNNNNNNNASQRNLIPGVKVLHTTQHEDSFDQSNTTYPTMLPNVHNNNKSNNSLARTSTPPSAGNSVLPPHYQQQIQQQNNNNNPIPQQNVFLPPIPSVATIMSKLVVAPLSLQQQHELDKEAERRERKRLCELEIVFSRSATWAMKRSVLELRDIQSLKPLAVEKAVVELHSKLRDVRRENPERHSDDLFHFLEDELVQRKMVQPTVNAETVLHRDRRTPNNNNNNNANRNRSAANASKLRVSMSRVSNSSRFENGTSNEIHPPALTPSIISDHNDQSIVANNNNNNNVGENNSHDNFIGTFIASNILSNSIFAGSARSAKLAETYRRIANSGARSPTPTTSTSNEISPSRVNSQSLHNFLGKSGATNNNNSNSTTNSLSGTVNNSTTNNNFMTSFSNGVGSMRKNLQGSPNSFYSSPGGSSPTTSKPRDKTAEALELLKKRLEEQEKSKQWADVLRLYGNETTPGSTKKKHGKHNSDSQNKSHRPGWKHSGKVAHNEGTLFKSLISGDASANDNNNNNNSPNSGAKHRRRKSTKLFSTSAAILGPVGKPNNNNNNIINDQHSLLVNSNQGSSTATGHSSGEIISNMSASRIPPHHNSPSAKTTSTITTTTKTRRSSAILPGEIAAKADEKQQNGDLNHHHHEMNEVRWYFTTKNQLFPNQHSNGTANKESNPVVSATELISHLAPFAKVVDVTFLENAATALPIPSTSPTTNTTTGKTVHPPLHSSVPEPPNVAHHFSLKEVHKMDAGGSAFRLLPEKSAQQAIVKKLAEGDTILGTRGYLTVIPHNDEARSLLTAQSNLAAAWKQQEQEQNPFHLPVHNNNNNNANDIASPRRKRASSVFVEDPMKVDSSAQQKFDATKFLASTKLEARRSSYTGASSIPESSLSINSNSTQGLTFQVLPDQNVLIVDPNSKNPTSIASSSTSRPETPTQHNSQGTSKSNNLTQQQQQQQQTSVFARLGRYSPGIEHAMSSHQRKLQQFVGPLKFGGLIHVAAPSNKDDVAGTEDFVTNNFGVPAIVAKVIVKKAIDEELFPTAEAPDFSAMHKKMMENLSEDEKEKLDTKPVALKDDFWESMVPVSNNLQSAKQITSPLVPTPSAAQTSWTNSNNNNSNSNSKNSAAASNAPHKPSPPSIFNVAPPNKNNNTNQSPSALIALNAAEKRQHATANQQKKTSPIQSDKMISDHTSSSTTTTTTHSPNNNLTATHNGNHSRSTSPPDLTYTPAPVTKSISENNTNNNNNNVTSNSTLELPIAAVVSRSRQNSISAVSHLVHQEKRRQSQLQCQDSTQSNDPLEIHSAGVFPSTSEFSNKNTNHNNNNNNHANRQELPQSIHAVEHKKFDQSNVISLPQRTMTVTDNDKILSPPAATLLNLKSSSSEIDAQDPDVEMQLHHHHHHQQTHLQSSSLSSSKKDSTLSENVVGFQTNKIQSEKHIARLYSHKKSLSRVPVPDRVYRVVCELPYLVGIDEVNPFLGDPSTSLAVSHKNDRKLNEKEDTENDRVNETCKRHLPRGCRIVAGGNMGNSVLPQQPDDDYDINAGPLFTTSFAARQILERHRFSKNPRLTRDEEDEVADESSGGRRSLSPFASGSVTNPNQNSSSARGNSPFTSREQHQKKKLKEQQAKERQEEKLKLQQLKEEEKLKQPQQPSIRMPFLAPGVRLPRPPTNQHHQLTAASLASKMAGFPDPLTCAGAGGDSRLEKEYNHLTHRRVAKLGAMVDELRKQEEDDDGNDDDDDDQVQGEGNTNRSLLMLQQPVPPPVAITKEWKNAAAPSVPAAFRKNRKNNNNNNNNSNGRPNAMAQTARNTSESEETFSFNLTSRKLNTSVARNNGFGMAGIAKMS